jgi:hypothetical protein
MNLADRIRANANASTWVNGSWPDGTPGVVDVSSESCNEGVME